MIKIQIICCLIWLGFSCTLAAQTEAEGPVDRLQVRTNGEHAKTMQSVGNGDKVKLKLRDEPKWVKGKISELRDSSIVVGERYVQLSKIVQLNSPPDIASIVPGILLFLFAAGLGFVGWVLGKLMLQKRLHTWWEWALVILGALLVVIFLPLFLIGALLVWALSSRKYPIGGKYILQVFHKRPPSA